MDRVQIKSVPSNDEFFDKLSNSKVIAMYINITALHLMMQVFINISRTIIKLLQLKLYILLNFFLKYQKHPKIVPDDTHSLKIKIKTKADTCLILSLYDFLSSCCFQFALRIFLFKLISHTYLQKHTKAINFPFHPQDLLQAKVIQHHWKQFKKGRKLGFPMLPMNCGDNNRPLKGIIGRTDQGQTLKRRLSSASCSSVIFSSSKILRNQGSIIFLFLRILRMF